MIVVRRGMIARRIGGSAPSALIGRIVTTGVRHVMTARQTGGSARSVPSIARIATTGALHAMTVARLVMTGRRTAGSVQIVPCIARIAMTGAPHVTTGALHAMTGRRTATTGRRTAGSVQIVRSDKIVRSDPHIARIAMTGVQGAVIARPLPGSARRARTASTPAPCSATPTDRTMSRARCARSGRARTAYPMP